MSANLEGRVAIVTGAAKGMGAEICLALAREGAHVALAARERGPLETLARDVEKLGRRTLVEPTDVTDEAAVQRLVERTKSALGGRINVLALHPGIVDGPRMDRLCREKARKRGWTLEQVREEYLQEMALRRVTTARNIADAVVFLASDASQNMTGQSITVDGGWDV